MLNYDLEQVVSVGFYQIVRLLEMQMNIHLVVKCFYNRTVYVGLCKVNILPMCRVMKEHIINIT